jgi:phage/plasmid primase-like uncharacterized protein
MSYQSYPEQIKAHLSFLREQGLAVETIEFGDVVRCRAIDEDQGRGKYAYKSYTNGMAKDRLGIVTLCRGRSGTWEKFKTYGVATGSIQSPSTVGYSHVIPGNGITKEHEEVASRAYGFWQHSSLSGLSDYLILKAVGNYGIRFRSSEQYGNVAVVPMRDENSRLWSYQLLNPDGTKRMPKGALTEGLFHRLQAIADGKPIGIAESYVTAATCFELSGIPMICCFSSDNMPEVARVIRKLYPRSQIILFADNDRHLEVRGLQNKGVCKAQEALKHIGQYGWKVVPDFVEISPSKDASDWNDLMRLKGKEFTKRQMLERTGKLSDILHASY